MQSVDIIVPHYNGSHLIKRLLDSTPNNGWVKVYVIDDHSNEEHFNALKKVCSDYAHVKVLQGEMGKKGPGNARNFGIQNSKSKWLFFADADDYFEEDAFKKINPFIKSLSDVIYFPHTSIIEETGKLGSRHKQYQDLVNTYLETRDNKLFYKFYSPCSKLVSRQLLTSHRIQFDDGIGGEDNNFSLKCAYYSKNIEVCNHSIYVIVESNQSMTASYSNQVIINHFQAMSRFNDFLQEHGESSYQAPMLGWICKACQISYKCSLKWFFQSLKKGYPMGFRYYLRKAFL